MKHRSPDRFIGNLKKLLKSGIMRTLWPELLKYTSIAFFVCIYNSLLVTGYEDLGGMHHEALTSDFPVCKLPTDFFSLTTPSLALLLGTFTKHEARSRSGFVDRRNWVLLTVAEPFSRFILM